MDKECKEKNNRSLIFIILLGVLPSCIILYLVGMSIRIFLTMADFNTKIRLILPLVVAIFITLIVFAIPVFILRIFHSKSMR